MSKELEGIKDLFDRIDSTSFRASAAMEWIDFYKKGGCFREFFDANNMKKVVVYGYGKLGQTLIEELMNENINVEYIIDKKAATINCPLKVLTIDSDLPQCDVVIITVSGYNALREKLWKKGIRNVVSLKELLA